MQDKENNHESASKSAKQRVATNHCCYGLCNSDSRYSDREHMQNVSCILFPKPHKEVEKCKRWVLACGWENFTVEINKWTYICSQHFVGGAGPTLDIPDPIPATHANTGNVYSFSSDPIVQLPHTSTTMLVPDGY